ncbi:MAG: family 43 glycosylhydrolase [Muribaculaceae bacterium]|nr:family 43 glycosylhydrolase [Muribaculaceae bacterium]
MKLFKCKVNVAIAAVSVLTMASGQLFAQNPICQTHFTPDPAPVVVGDTLYLYTGCDDISADPDNFVMREYLCFTTTDMVNWTHHAPVFNNEGFGTKDCAYAAQMAYRDGKWYYYTSTFGIPVLVSDSPYGPFTNPLGGRNFLIKSEDTNYSGHGWEDIDPTVLIDDDGQAYMYWGNNALYAVKLNDDMISYDGDIKVFEIKDKDAFGPDYEEAPWLAKRGDKYYLAYASFCPEATDWAWSDSPLGPWKYGGQLMRAFEHGGMGNHTGMCEYKGQWYFFYMDEGLQNAHSKRRTTSVIPFEFNEDGSLPYMHHDKRGVLKSVDPLNPFIRQQGETIAWEEGIGIGYDDIYCVYVNDVDPGDYIKVREVNFGKGAKDFTARVRNGKPGSKIEVRLDAPNGELIATLDASSGSEWKEKKAKTIKRDGIHDLYFVFEGGGNDLLQFDSWKFNQ